MKNFVTTNPTQGHILIYLGACCHAILLPLCWMKSQCYFRVCEEITQTKTTCQHFTHFLILVVGSTFYFMQRCTVKNARKLQSKLKQPALVLSHTKRYKMKLTMRSCRIIALSKYDVLYIQQIDKHFYLLVNFLHLPIENIKLVSNFNFC